MNLQIDRFGALDEKFYYSNFKGTCLDSGESQMSRMNNISYDVSARKDFKVEDWTGKGH